MKRMGAGRREAAARCNAAEIPTGCDWQRVVASSSNDWSIGTTYKNPTCGESCLQGDATTPPHLSGETQPRLTHSAQLHTQPMWCRFPTCREQRRAGRLLYAMQEVRLHQERRSCAYLRQCLVYSCTGIQNQWLARYPITGTSWCHDNTAGHKVSNGDA